MVRMSVLRFVAVLLLLFAFSSFFLLGALAAETEETALSAIGSAESVMESAFEVVLEAEEAGADVSGLLEELNDGAEALSKAHMFYRVGRYDDAVYFADLCYGLVDGIETRVDELQSAAVTQRRYDLYLTSLSSVVAVGFVCGVGFFGWRFFRERCRRKILEMKPEVGSDES